MLHGMKYILLRNLREKSSLFWTLLFPIILGTLFHFALTGLDESESMNSISAALVEEEGSSALDQKIFREYLTAMDGEILELQVVTEEAGEQALQEGKIKGIFRSGQERSLEVLSNGLEESILSGLLETYEKNRAVLVDLGGKNPVKLLSAVGAMEDYGSYTQQVSLGGRSMNDISSYYFALIAMTCLYGGFLGLYAAIQLQANLSPQGARCAVSPTHQLQRIITDIFSIFLLHFGEMLVVLGYLSFVLGDLDVGESWGKVLAVVALGSWFGVSLGVLIGSIGKMGEAMKIGLFLGISMVASFLSGLMIGGIMDLIEKHAPIVNRLNPAALIADAFYCICIYEDMDRYVRDLSLLAGMSLVFAFVAFLSVRRVRYDSI